MRHNFLPKEHRSSGIKSIDKSKKTKTTTTKILPAPKRQRPNRDLYKGGVLENLECAPVPHPYPATQYIMSEITDTFDGTQTVTTNQKETSPAIISQDERLLNFNNGHQLINTDSSKK